MMNARYRGAAALAAVLFGVASAGSTVYAAGPGNHTQSSANRSGSNSKGSWDKGSQWKWQDQRDTRNNQSSNRDRFRDHCCDNNNRHDNHSSDNSSHDCSWLKDHDHDRWLQECSH